MELRMMVSALAITFYWKGVPNQPGSWDQEMRPHDHFVFHPWNGKCVLELKERP